ncbi:hypothetical protein JCM8208_003674 [Rhodotorula glutinis]
MPAAHTTTTCAVCGAPASDCCSSCAKYGSRLSFCSRDHFKLIWKAHRDVCGLNSKPFMPPDLSDADVETVRSRVPTPRSYPSLARVDEQEAARALWATRYGKGGPARSEDSVPTPTIAQAVQLAAYAGLWRLSGRDVDGPAPEIRPIHRVAAAYLDIRAAHPVTLDQHHNDQLGHALVALCALAAHESAAVSRAVVSHESAALSHALGAVLDCLSHGGACFGHMQGVFAALRRALADLVVLDFSLRADEGCRQEVSVKIMARGERGAEGV